MSPIHYLFSIGSVAVLCASAFADTIILKSGEKLEGKVIGETATEYTVEVKVSAGITDQTKIAKDTVAKIEKEQLDEIAWQSVKNIKPGPNSLAAGQYDAVVRALRIFATDYPNSPHKAEAEKTIALFAEEKKRVEAGGVRLGEKWLGREEVEKERYQIGATLAFQHMRGQVAAGDLAGALNSFEQIKRNFGGARIFPDAVETAKSALAGLKTMVERAHQTYKLQQAEFEAGVANAVEPQKSELIAARQREAAQGEAALASAERAGLKWPQLVPRSERIITTITEKIPSEMQEMASFEVAKMRESIKAAQEAAKQIADKKADAAEELVRKASDLWNENEMLKQLQLDLSALRTAIASAPAEPAPVPESEKPADSEKTASATSNEPIETQVEGEKPFLLTPGGIITSLVLLAAIIGGVSVYKKIRGKASDVLE